jgi:hypothetical protein
MPISRDTPPTLEAAGITPGSALLATPEEQAEADAAEAEHLAHAATEIDQTLGAWWSCRACSLGNAFGSATGLCGPCATVAAQLTATRHAAELVNGHARVELVTAYLERQEQTP